MGVEETAFLTLSLILPVKAGRVGNLNMMSIGGARVGRDCISEHATDVLVDPCRRDLAINIQKEIYLVDLRALLLSSW